MTTTDTLRQLLADATRHSPAPWVVDPELPGDVRDDSNEPVSWGTDSAGAALIAAAPTHLADLITALEREVKLREAHKPRPTGIPRPDRDGQEYVVCNQCRDDYGEPLLYPCPTICILDGNE